MTDDTPYLLGIDIGSSSTKAVLTTPPGEVVCATSRSPTLSQPRPGWVEHDADSVWRSAVADVARELTSAGGAVAAVCVSGIGLAATSCTTTAGAETRDPVVARQT